MKIRLLLMGTLISALSATLLVARGFSDALAGLLAIGLVELVVGLIWK
jgi:hypothetical protein